MLVQWMDIASVKDWLPRMEIIEQWQSHRLHLHHAGSKIGLPSSSTFLVNAAGLACPDANRMLCCLLRRLRAALITPGAQATDHLRQLGITPGSSKHSGVIPPSPCIAHLA